MFCKFCGGKLEYGDHYCSKCGARITAPRNQNISNYGTNQQPPAAAKVKDSFLALIFGIIAIAIQLFYSYEPFAQFIGFSLGVTAIVLGSIGLAKRRKYGLYALLTGVTAFIIFVGMLN